MQFTRPVIEAKARGVIKPATLKSLARLIDPSGGFDWGAELEGAAPQSPNRRVHRRVEWSPPLRAPQGCPPRIQPRWRPCRSRLWRCRARRTLGGRGRPRDVTTAGGTYVAVEGTTACDPCLLGHHCAAGASVALPCEAGSYSAGLDLASQGGAARALRARRARRLQRRLRHAMRAATRRHRLAHARCVRRAATRRQPALQRAPSVRQAASAPRVQASWKHAALARTHLPALARAASVPQAATTARMVQQRVTCAWRATTALRARAWRCRVRAAASPPPPTSLKKRSARAAWRGARASQAQQRRSSARQAATPPNQCRRPYVRGRARTSCPPGYQPGSPAISPAVPCRVNNSTCNSSTRAITRAITRIWAVIARGIAAIPRAIIAITRLMCSESLVIAVIARLAITGAIIPTSERRICSLPFYFL